MIEPGEEVPTSGLVAHGRGYPMSACPWPPADPEGARWRTSWIAAESTSRRRDGTFGASDEAYQRAGLGVPERTTSGAPVIHGPFTGWVTLSQGWRGDRRAGGPVLVLTPDLVRAIRQLGKTMTEVAEKIAAAFGMDAGELADRLRLLGLDEEREVLQHAAEVQRARKRHRPCPIHGDTSAHGGNCLPCARGAARRASGPRGRQLPKR